MKKMNMNFSLLFLLVVFRLRWGHVKLMVTVKVGCLCGPWSQESRASWLVILMVAFIQVREGQNY